MTKWLADLVIPGWLKTTLIYVLLAAVILAGLYFIYDTGVSAEHDRNVSAENASMAKLAKRNFELIAQVREVEHQKVVQQNEFTKQFEKRNDDAQTTTSNLINRVASGAQQLRIPTKQSSTCGSDTNTLGTAPRPAQEKTAELSPAASEFLITFASECDATAEKLNLCIDIAEADRQENSLTALTLGSEVETATGGVIPTSPIAAPPDSVNESNELVAPQ